MKKRFYVGLLCTLFVLFFSTTIFANGLKWFDGFIECPKNFLVENEQVRFRADIGAGDLLVMDDRLIFQLRGIDEGSSEQMVIEFENTMPDKTFEGLGKRSSRHLFQFKDGQQEKYAFNEVMIKGIYEFIDLHLFARENGVKYNFIIHPGGDASKVSLKYSGSTLLQPNTRSVMMENDFGKFHETMPLIYQDIDGRRHEVSGVIRTAGQRAQYLIEEYNPSHKLIVDPDVVFTSYLGSTGSDEVIDMKFNSNNELIVLSTTSGSDFVSPNSNNSAASGMTKDFVLTKFSNGGEAIQWSFYFQGDDFTATALDIFDSNNDIVVVGYGSGGILPSNQPTTAFGVKGGVDGVIAIFNDNGLIARSTEFGGSSDDYITDVGIDPDDHLVIVGFTNSATPDFPITSGADQGTIGGGYDAFISQLTFTTSPSLHWSTYKGSTEDDAYFALAIDKSWCGGPEIGNPNYGKIYVTGATQTSGFFNFNRYYGGAAIPAYSHSITGVLPIRGLTAIAIYSDLGVIEWATDMGIHTAVGDNHEAGLDISLGHLEDDGDTWPKILVSGVSDRDYPNPSPPERYERVNAPGPQYQSGNRGQSDGFIMEFMLNVKRTESGGVYNYEAPESSMSFWAGPLTFNPWQLDGDYYGPCLGGSMYTSEPPEGFGLLTITSGTEPPFKLVFSSLFGGNGDDEIRCAMYDESNRIVSTGINGSSDWWNAAAVNGASDAFLMRIETPTTYSSYMPLNTPVYTLDHMESFGGSDNETGNVLALDDCDDIYIGGRSTSSDMSVNIGAFQTSNNSSGGTGFITKWSDQISATAFDGAVFCRNGFSGPVYPIMTIGNSASVFHPSGLPVTVIDPTGYVDPDNLMDELEILIGNVPLGSEHEFHVRRDEMINGCLHSMVESFTVVETEGYVAPTLSASYDQTHQTPIALFDPAGTSVDIDILLSFPGGFAQVNSANVPDILINGLKEFDVQAAINYLNTQGYNYCGETAMQFTVEYTTPDGCVSESENIVIDITDDMAFQGYDVSYLESLDAVYELTESCVNFNVTLNDLDDPGSVVSTEDYEFEISDGTSTVIYDNTAYSPFFDASTMVLDLEELYDEAIGHTSLSCASNFSVTYRISMSTATGCTRVFEESFDLNFTIPHVESFDQEIPANLNNYVEAYDFEQNPNVQGATLSYEMDLTDGTTSVTLSAPFPTGVFDDITLQWDMEAIWAYFQTEMPTSANCPNDIDVTYKVSFTDINGCSRQFDESFKIVLPWKAAFHDDDFCAYDNRVLELFDFQSFGSGAISSVDHYHKRSGTWSTTTISSSAVYDDFVTSSVASPLRYDQFDIEKAVDFEENDCSCTMDNTHNEVRYSINYTNLVYKSCTYSATDEITLIYNDESSSFTATSVTFGATPLQTTGSDYDLTSDPYKFSHCYSTDLDLSANTGTNHSWFLWDHTADMPIEKLGDGNNFSYSVSDHTTWSQWFKCAVDDAAGVCASKNGLYFKINFEGVRAPLPALSSYSTVLEGCDEDEVDLCGYNSTDNKLIITHHTDQSNNASLWYNPGFTDPVDNVFKPETGKWQIAGHIITGNERSGAFEALNAGFYEMRASDFWAPGGGCPTVKSKLLKVNDVSSITQTITPSSNTVMCPVTTNYFEVNVTSSGSYSYELWDMADPSVTHHVKDWNTVSAGSSSEDIVSEGHYAYRVVDNANYCYTWTNTLEFESMPDFQIENGLTEVIMGLTSPYATLEVDNVSPNSLIPTYYGVAAPITATSTNTDWYRDGVFYANGSAASNARSVNITNALDYGYYHAETPYSSTYCASSQKAKSNLVKVKPKCYDPSNPPAGSNVTVWDASVSSIATNPGPAINLIYVSGAIDISSSIVLDGVTLIFSQGSGLIVKSGTSSLNPGGNLTISDSKLIGCDTYWNGITVEGDASFPAELTMTVGAGANSEIQGALIGVYSKDGAETDIENTTFEDNHVDILIGPSTTGTNANIQNNLFKGRFAVMNPSDITSHPYFAAPGAPMLYGAYIYLDGCNTVEIKNNVFNSKHGLANLSGLDHVSIWAKGADDIDITGTSQKYEGVFKQALFLEDCDGWQILDQSIGSATYKDIETGMAILSSDNMSVERCQFEEIATGIYSKDCNSLDVYDCAFKNLKEDGMVFLSELPSQQLCTVKKSLFDGNKFGLSIGRDDHPTKDQTNITQDKREIEFTCNKFINNDVGILVTADTRSQGNATNLDAGNMFSDPLSSTASDNVDYDMIIYQGIGFEYYYHDPSACSSTFGGYEPNSDLNLNAWTGYTSGPLCIPGAYGKQYVMGGSKVVDHRYLICFGHHSGIKSVCNPNAGASSTNCANGGYGSWKKETSIEPELTQEINIYPNPFRNNILVELPKGVSGRIQVRNLVGQLVYEGVSAPGILTIPTTSWPSGAYVVMVQSAEGQTLMQKLIKAN